MAVDTSKWKKEDLDALSAAGAAWNAASTPEAKDAAHKAAEDIRAKYGYTGGADGSQLTKLPTAVTSTQGNSQYTALDPSGNNYADMSGMSELHKAALEAAGNAYNSATTDAQREAAHKQAEAIRQLYGYSGGMDGSQYIPNQKVTQNQPNGNFTYSDAPTYTDPYAGRVQQLLNEITNRDPFSYDAASDPLYQQYREQYTREGQRAMQDTLGQVSARTGGLASSYAVSASQQANDYYMSQLADKIPELYQMAYQMYMDDLGLKVQDLGLIQGVSNDAYNRFRDDRNDWSENRDFAYDQFRDDIGDNQWLANYDRGVFESDRDYDRNNDEQAYQKEQDANTIAYERAMELLYAGVMPESSMLSAAGLTTAQANRLLEAAKTTSSSKAPVEASYKPKLSASAVVDALENGIVNDEMRQAYKYYYGQDWVGDDGGGGGDGIIHPETIYGKPLDEYSDAAGNYKEVSTMASDIYGKDGRAAAIAFLDEAYKSGALNVTDYSQLKKKYRDMK